MSATTAAVRTEARLFTREPGALFWILLFPTALVVVIGLVPPFREPNPDLGGLRVVDVYVTTSVLLAGIVAAVQSMPAVLAGYREQGVLRRLRTTPLHPGSILLAQVGLHLGAVLVSVALVVVTGHLVHDVPWPTAPGWWLLAVVVATVAAFAVGAVVTALGRSVRVTQTLGTVVFFPLMFTAGVWLPVAAMPGVLHDVVVATPVGAAASALDAAVVGNPPDVVDLVVIGGWSLVLGLVAVRWFRWE